MLFTSINVRGLSISWTILSKVLDMHISLKAYAFHKVQGQLITVQNFMNNAIFVSELHLFKVMWCKHHRAH